MFNIEEFGERLDDVVNRITTNLELGEDALDYSYCFAYDDKMYTVIVKEGMWN